MFVRVSVLISRIFLAVSALAMTTSSASAAIVPYTETFDTGTNNWLTGASGTPTFNATGGIDDSGFISFTTTFTSGTGTFGGPALQILMRGNNAANASGDAFVGNWISDGVGNFSVAVRHNSSATLTLYARFDAGAGAAASLAPDASYSVAPNTWTTITIPISNSNPPFTSFGAGSFNGVFSNVQNLQLGLYVPATTTFTDLRFDIDNVRVAAVAEPASFGLVGLAMGSFVLFRRLRKASPAPVFQPD